LVLANTSRRPTTLESFLQGETKLNTSSPMIRIWWYECEKRTELRIREKKCKIDEKGLEIACPSNRNMGVALRVQICLYAARWRHHRMLKVKNAARFVFLSRLMDDRIFLLTGSIARSAKRRLFNLLRGRFWSFSPHMGDTLHRWGPWGWNLARRRGLSIPF